MIRIVGARLELLLLRFWKPATILGIKSADEHDGRKALPPHRNVLYLPLPT